jgi:hypothetical protein
VVEEVVRLGDDVPHARHAERCSCHTPRWGQHSRSLRAQAIGRHFLSAGNAAETPQPAHCSVRRPTSRRRDSQAAPRPLTGYDRV